MARRRASPAADPREQVADRLHSAAIRLLRRLRREDARSGLTAPRLSVLSVLVFGGRMTLGRLAEAEQVRAPTMTRLVTALETEGLVARERDPGDRRQVWVRATPAGRAVLARGRARRVAALAASLRALPREDQDALEAAVGVLERITRDHEARAAGDRGGRTTS